MRKEDRTTNDEGFFGGAACLDAEGDRSATKAIRRAMGGETARQRPAVSSGDAVVNMSDNFGILR